MPPWKLKWWLSKQENSFFFENMYKADACAEQIESLFYFMAPAFAKVGSRHKSTSSAFTFYFSFACVIWNTICCVSRVYQGVTHHIRSIISYVGWGGGKKYGEKHHQESPPRCVAICSARCESRAVPSTSSTRQVYAESRKRRSIWPKIGEREAVV